MASSTPRRTLRWALPVLVVVMAGVYFGSQSNFMARFYPGSPTGSTAYCAAAGTTGAILWQTDVGGTIAGPVTIGPQMVYVGEFGGGTSIHALNKQDGSSAWSTDIYTSVESSLALARDGTLYAATLRSNSSTPATTVTTGEGDTVASALVGVVSLDSTTGEIKAFSEAGVGGQGVDSSPTVSVDGNSVYVATVDLRAKYDDDTGIAAPTVGAYDAATLEPLWQHESTGWSYAGGMSFPDGSYLHAAEVTGAETRTGTLTLYDEDGNVVWTQTADSEFSKSSALQKVENQTYIVTGTQEGVIYKFDFSGNLVWETDLGTAGFGAIVVDDTNAYFTTTTSSEHPMNLVALDLDTGEIVWEVRMANNASTPAVGSTAVYAVDDDGNLIAFNRTDGTELWRVATGSPVYGYVKIDSVCKTAYVTAENGTVYAVYLGEGAFKSWSQARGGERGTGHL